MFGLAGVILGKKRRRAEEREHLAWLFTRLLVLSESRGPQATGMAWLNRDGKHRLFKRPVSAGQFVTDKAFHEVLAAIDNRTTVLLGHTRWRIRGDERVNRNNHPIWAGDVIGTHNGTIYNADYLFRRFKLPRFAQVDSELLFRLAARAARSGQMDVEWFKERLRRCRGQITAINRRHRAVVYASDPAFLDAVLADERGWQELSVSAMSLIVFRHEVLMEFSGESLEFIAQAK